MQEIKYTPAGMIENHFPKKLSVAGRSLVTTANRIFVISTKNEDPPAVTCWLKNEASEEYWPVRSPRALVLTLMEQYPDHFDGFTWPELNK